LIAADAAFRAENNTHRSTLNLPGQRYYNKTIEVLLTDYAVTRVRNEKQAHQKRRFISNIDNQMTLSGWILCLYERLRTNMPFGKTRRDRRIGYIK
jgi:hypothetical protein